MKNYEIYSRKPAKKWDDGIPLGNGRLGAMVLGHLKEEIIVINEETLCYGPSRERENPDAALHLQEIRELLLKGKVEKAAFLSKMALTSTPKYNNPYQPVGDLRLCFLNHSGKGRGFESRLDIGKAVARVAYEMDETHYEREYLVSKAYQVLAIRIRTKGKHKITMSANISRKPFEEFTGILAEGTAGNWGENGACGMHYLSAVRIASKKGKTMGDAVYIEDAEEVVVYLAAGTDYEECLEGTKKNSQDAYNSLYQKIGSRLDAAQAAGYEEIKRRHIEDYQDLYKNFGLDLMGDSPIGLSTAELLSAYRAGDTSHENYLTELLTAFARYLMIASSDSCLLPANLQGLWNGSYEPPWQCQYTININTEMNYWFAEKAGLSRCHLPVLNLVKLLAKNGRKTAEKLYHARGFCAHHNTNVWGCSAPEGIFDASPYWVMGGAWMCLHLWEHYLYTEEQSFLKEAMPLMREAIRFFEDYLFELPNGMLITGPVVSPENTYRSAAGETGALCMGTAMDSAILRQLLQSYLDGMKVLGMKEEKEEAALSAILKKLPPLMIGKDKRLLEWMEEFEEMEPGHRHISHLYALHPGHEITPETPEYFEAAKKTLSTRLAHGGGHTGWSRAWQACFAARLREPEELKEHVGELLKRCIQDNLLDVHPPFQIDGNFGIAEAVLEGIVQNLGDKVELLPALPKSWKDGSLKGYILQGNTRLDMSWKDGTLTKLKLTAQKTKTYRLHFQDEIKEVVCQAGKTIVLI